MLIKRKARRRHDLLQDPVGPTLFSMTVPTTIGVVAVISYLLVDTYFISLLGTSQLAALGFTFPATMLVTYFGVGLGIGTSALVAKAIGARNQLLAAELTFASILLGLVLGLVLIVPGLGASDPLFSGMGAETALLPLIRQYMSVWYFGIPLLLMQFAGTAVIRASGNTRLHGTLMTAGAVLNVILDPIFIFGWGPFPAFGIAGAALTTVTSWALTVIVICYVLARKEGLLKFKWPGLGQILDTWKKLGKITVPAALANMITPVAAAVITTTLATYGTHAVAAYGVINRVESFIMIVVLGMSMSLPPFISQNFGAGLLERVSLALRLSLRFVMFWQFALYLLVALAAPYIAAVFTADPAVRQLITLILRILPASFAFQGMVVLTASCFNALHAPRNALLTSLIRFFVFYVPLALFGAHLADIPGLFTGAAIGNLLAGLLVTRWITAYVRNLQK
ncbi:MAG: MATE family efflux transporter [Pseudomonadales bacterium]|nr:MATE family efflux transporter [Pseudomonadales bacterium]